MTAIISVLLRLAISKPTMQIGSPHFRIAAVDLGHLIGPIRSGAWCRDVERGRDGNPRCNRAAAAHRAGANRRAARVVPGWRQEAAVAICARRRRTPIVRMVAKPIRNSTALLTMAQIDMNADHATTLKFSATNRFNAAEKNISPAHTKPKIKAMSGTSSMATGGR